MTNEEFDEHNSSENKNEHKKVEQPAEIAEELKKIFADDEIPQKSKKKIIKIISEIAFEKKSSFSGPIPPPEILRGYNNVITDGGERIMKMAESQSAHRIRLEELTIREGIKQSGRGQTYGFILGLVGLGLAGLLAYLGHETTAVVLASTTIVGLVAVFVIGKKSQSKDLSDKN